MSYELEQLKEFIKSEIKKGYDLETIKTTLHSSGFSKKSIKKAFATLDKKTKKTEPEIYKPKKPGLLERLFTPKKKEKTKTKPKKKHKPKKKKTPKKGLFKSLLKPKKKTPRTKPKKKGPGFIEKFFFKHEKIKPKPAQKTKPKEKKALKPAKPKKTKKGIFYHFFGRKIQVKKPKKTIPKPKPPKKTKKKGLFKNIFKSKKPKPKKKHKPIKLPKIPHIKGTTAVIALILFFLIAGVIIWAFPASCATENCFIKHANKCEAATYSNIIEGTTFLYETNNCILKKTAVSLSPEEPIETKKDFEGKSMYCAYKENDFSPLHVNTITGMLDSCEGELKRAIQKYVV